MGKIELKKQKKRRDILESAYEQFTTIGYHNTTILGIALHAGVGKGTFYLYFKSKEDVRDELIMLKSSQLLLEACHALEEHEAASAEPIAIADQFIFIADSVINALRQDITLLKFISKNLTWGMLVHSDRLHAVDEDILDFREFILNKLLSGGERLRDPEMLLFTLLELTNATCYNAILYDEPVPFEEYRPYLYGCIRSLVEADLVR